MSDPESQPVPQQPDQPEYVERPQATGRPPHHAPAAGRAHPDRNDLQALCSALHLDASVVRRFIADYLRLLPTRLDRIDVDLARGDLPAATVDLLSLATSSTMLGADEVTEAADQLREQTAAGDAVAVAKVRIELISRAEDAKLRLSRISAA